MVKDWFIVQQYNERPAQQGENVHERGKKETFPRYWVIPETVNSAIKNSTI